jgi:hypothetical protein
MTYTRTLPPVNNRGSRSGGVNIFHVLAAALLITCLFAGVVQAAMTPEGSASPHEPWAGTWNTSFGSHSGPIGGTLTLQQMSSIVTGIQSNGTVLASVQGNTLSGTWFDSSRIGHEIGLFRLVLSDDKNSFAGTWAPISEGTAALGDATRFWNGTRV